MNSAFNMYFYVILFEQKHIFDIICVFFITFFYFNWLGQMSGIFFLFILLLLAKKFFFSISNVIFKEKV